METATPVMREVHLARLRSFHEALVGALGESGVGGARLGEILDRQVLAECQQCGMSVKGTDIAGALAAESAHTAANPKHARLLQHYCARAGCSSYFYRFNFTPVPGIDWSPVLDRAAQIEGGRAEASATEGQLRHRLARSTRRRRVLRWVGGGIVIVGLWIFRHWWRTGALPGMPPGSRYQVDPGSLPPDPNRGRP